MLGDSVVGSRGRCRLHGSGRRPENPWRARIGRCGWCFRRSSWAALPICVSACCHPSLLPGASRDSPSRRPSSCVNSIGCCVEADGAGARRFVASGVRGQSRLASAGGRGFLALKRRVGAICMGARCAWRGAWDAARSVWSGCDVLNPVALPRGLCPGSRRWRPRFLDRESDLDDHTSVVDRKRRSLHEKVTETIPGIEAGPTVFGGARVGCREARAEVSGRRAQEVGRALPRLRRLVVRPGRTGASRSASFVVRPGCSGFPRCPLRTMRRKAASMKRTSPLSRTAHARSKGVRAEVEDGLAGPGLTSSRVVEESAELGERGGGKDAGAGWRRRRVVGRGRSCRAS